MIKVGMLSICLMLLAACGDSEPVSTTYKKSIGKPAGAATGTGTATGGDAAGLAAGTTLYNNKCASCHGALASSAKKGRTATQITGSATISSHSGVSPFPTATEAAQLETALK